jgi:ribose transport system permease protein
VGGVSGRTATTGTVRRAWLSNLTRQLARQPIWAFVVIELLFFGLMPATREVFFNSGNLLNVLLQSTFIGVIALGMTFVMIDGEIDLSVGAMMALAASLSVGLQPQLGLIPAALVGLASGAALGLFNGAVTYKTGVDSFIVTLGAMLGIRGLVFVYTQQDSFFSMNFSYSDFGMSSVGAIPTLAIIFLALAVILHYVLSNTRHGRTTYAVGGNRSAALNAGVRIGRHLLINFTLLGTLAAFSGILLSTQMGASTPTMGTVYELWVITAVVLGGTKLAGGHGSIVGTVGGVLAIQLLRNGMNLMQVQAYWVQVILGTMLIVVLFIDKRTSRTARGGVEA